MRILLAEDDKIARQIVSAILVRYGHEVVMVEDGQAALEEVKRGDIRFVISDWIMPKIEGPDLCRRIRETITERYVYIILLTSKSRKSDLIQGIDAGADDYLIKPVDPEELNVRIRTGERILSLESRLREAHGQLTLLASRDELTNLLNRRTLFQRTDFEILRASREGLALSAVMFDLDHFKQVNDTHGHIGGDKVLAAVAQRARNSCRPYDIIGRYGGEEFVIVLPGIRAEMARNIAERLRRTVEREPIDLPTGSISVTASFGAAEFRPGIDTETGLFFNRVDQAMYQAKREGRNRVCVAQPSAS